jgi:hypothetical protein
MAAGREIVKSTSEPTGILASSSNKTPFAEMFSDSVRHSPAFDFSEIGSLMGNRTALCISG